MKYIKYSVLVIYNLLRLTLLSLFNFGNLKFSLVELISPGASIEIVGTGAEIKMGRTSILSHSTIKASGGKINIGNKVFINKNCMIVSRKNILIGAGTTIGPNTVIYDHDHAFGRKKASGVDYTVSEVIIGENVWIGAGVIILKGTNIGDNCVIGAGSIIKGSVANNTLVIPDKKNITINIE